MRFADISQTAVIWKFDFFQNFHEFFPSFGLNCLCSSMYLALPLVNFFLYLLLHRVHQPMERKHVRSWIPCMTKKGYLFKPMEREKCKDLTVWRVYEVVMMSSQHIVPRKERTGGISRKTWNGLSVWYSYLLNGTALGNLPKLVILNRKPKLDEWWLILHGSRTNAT